MRDRDVGDASSASAASCVCLGGAANCVPAGAGRATSPCEGWKGPRQRIRSDALLIKIAGQAGTRQTSFRHPVHSALVFAPQGRKP